MKLRTKRVVVFLLCFLMVSSFSFSRLASGQILGFTQVQAGVQHTLALDSNGNVWAWGLNQFGQIGDGTTTVRPYAVKVKGISDVKAISAGGATSAAVRSDGTVWTWGANYDYIGEHGTNSYHPVKIEGLTNIVSVSLGSGVLLALKDDGTVWGMGNNEAGQLGSGVTLSQSAAPVQIQGLSGIVSISAGGFHELALKNDGTVWSWGSNSSGQLGAAIDGYRSAIPVQVTGLTNVKSISAGCYYSTALSNDGKVWAWGENICGQLGDGTTTQSNKPVQVQGLDHISEIASGIRSTLALQDNGTVWVWGNDWTHKDSSNTFLGYALILKPTSIPGLKDISTLSSGGAWYTVITNGGKILTWGQNGGRLGDGAGEDKSAPGNIVDSLIVDNTRLFGEDRIQTAIAISKKMMPIDQSADSVLLATSEDFPDALVGASLGVLKNAPLLLASPYTKNEKTIEELNRVLKPGGTIYILGGTSVVSSSFESLLKGLPQRYKVQRLAGGDRYDTSAQIAQNVKTKQGGEIIIATGRDFPDSLSVSPYASANGIPIVLVDNKSIPAKIQAYLNSIQPQTITIVGGEGAVSSSVESKLRELFPKASIRRLGGGNRYETSTIIAKTLFGNDSPNIFVATGTNFPDALAGSIFAGSTLSPVVLVEPKQVPDILKFDYLNSLSDKKVVTLGGQGAVSENVNSDLEDRLK